MNMLRRLLIFVILLVLKLSLFGQGNYTLYFMDRVPQSNILNPAFQPKCNVYYSLSSFYVDFGNSTFSLSDILIKSPNSSVLITPLSEKADSNTRAQFLNKLKNRNTLYALTSNDIISMGFRKGDFYFTLGATLKNRTEFDYPGDLIRFFINGIDTATNYNFGNIGTHYSMYLELSLGISKKFNDAFSIGVRGKLLNGIIDVSSGNNTFSLKSTVDPLTKLYNLDINSDMTFNAYVPIMNIPSDSLFNGKNPVAYKDPWNHLPILKSVGFAADLGVSYFGINKLVLSASVIDLGYINWNQDVSNISLKGKFNFHGVDFKIDSTKEILKTMSDSLKNSFKITQSKTSYKTWLPTRIYAGVEFLPEEYFSLGLLSYTQVYKKEITQQLTVSANIKPFNMWHLSTNYSVFNNGFSSLGLGVALKLAVLQLYLISDNIPVRFGKYNGSPLVPYKLQSFNCRFGLNLVFGCNTKKKKQGDKPLIFEDVLMEK